MDPFIGQIMMFGGNFAPRGWALCDGSLLPISQNQALFSILGTTYGGDGKTNFALPDLRGRAPIHAGSGPGLSPRKLGQKGGVEQVTLTTSQIPSHSHTLQGRSDAAGSDDPSGRSLGKSNIYARQAADTAMAASSITATGGGQPHENMQPFLGINFIIALVGVYPSRS